MVTYLCSSRPPGPAHECLVPGDLARTDAPLTTLSRAIPRYLCYFPGVCSVLVYSTLPSQHPRSPSIPPECVCPECASSISLSRGTRFLTITIPSRGAHRAQSESTLMFLVFSSPISSLTPHSQSRTRICASHFKFQLFLSALTVGAAQVDCQDASRPAPRLHYRIVSQLQPPNQCSKNPQVTMVQTGPGPPARPLMTQTNHHDSVQLCEFSNQFIPDQSQLAGGGRNSRTELFNH